MPVFLMSKSGVILEHWNILQAHAPDVVIRELFIGLNARGGLGRVSTPIKDFDEKSKTGTTHSGSTYTCIGEPGLPHDEAIYVLGSLIGAEKVQKELFSKASFGALKFRYPMK